MRKKKRGFIKPVVVGFAALYLLAMGLSTYLVAVKFADEYGEKLAEAASVIQRNVYEREAAAEEEGQTDSEEREYDWRRGCMDRRELQGGENLCSGWAFVF